MEICIMSVKSFCMSFLSVGLFLAAISVGSLSFAGGTICGSGYGRCYVAALTRTLTYNFGSHRWVWKIDPYDVESFQLDIGFDPARAEVESIDYLSGFSQSTLPDLSRLGDGLLQDIAGTTASPIPGDVDMFQVVFRDLHPEQPVNSATFTAFASSNDFLIMFDPNTNDRYAITPANITGTSASVPEPSAPFLAIAAIAIGTVARRKRRRRVAGI
jgi:hypothetical protein